jgi:uncharacterized protein
MADKILKELGYPGDKAEKVKHCIISHRSKETEHRPETTEAKIVATADAMSHFDTVPHIFWAIASDYKLPMLDAIELMRGKIERDWNRKLLFPEAREAVKGKYEAFKVLWGMNEA